METIGRYKILGELGRGGCGIVYRALDPTIGRTVAIKTILLGGGADPSLVERFRREARSAGILSHPNIVTIHEFSETSDAMFIAMEYIDGQTLAQRMREGLLPVELTLSIIRAAADALDFAHEHHIVHRDVKPANFLINRQGYVKVADFGIAKLLDGDSSLTSTGMVIGTAQYMSPEQIAARDVTGRSDQFSLAVIAYEMLTGQRPFQGNSWASVMHAIMATEPPPLNQFRNELGDEVTGVLRKALAKDPKDRYATCWAFAEALERSLSGALAAPRAPLPMPPPEQPDRAKPLTAPLPTTEVARPVGRLPLTATIPFATAEASTPPAVEEPPPSAWRRWGAAAAAAVGVIVIGLAALAVLRTSSSPDAVQAPAPVTGSSAPAAPVSSAQRTSHPATAPPEASASRGSTLPASKADVQEPARVKNSPAKESPSRPANPVVPSPSPTASASPAARPPASVPQTSVTPASTASVGNAPRVSVATAPPASVATAPPVSVAPAPPASAAPAPPVSAPPVSVSPSPSTSAGVASGTAAGASSGTVAGASSGNLATAPRASVSPAPPASATSAPSVSVPPAATGQSKNDQQAKLAPDKAAKGATEDRARNARAADLRGVDQALKDYQSAYELKDAAALQAIWPSITKASLDEIRRSFRDASEVKMDLQPVGDPQISDNSATVICDRSVHQVIAKKLLQASNRVRIVLNRRGSGWVIQSVDLASH